MQKTLEVANISPTPQSQAPPRAIPVNLSDEVFWLQGEMNAVLEQLLITKATMDSHQRELAVNADITMHQNEAQATKAIKEAEMYQKHAEVCCSATIKEAEAHCSAAIKETESHHAIHTCALEKSHKESMLELEHEVLVDEGQDHWSFMEACRAVLQACQPKACGVLMYPL